MSDSNGVDPRWRGFYRFAGVMALAVVVVMLGEIFITMLPGGAREGDVTVVDWLAQYRDMPLMAIRNLGGVNMIGIALGLPVLIVLWGTHHEREPAWTLFALATSLLGAAIYYSINTALPMLTVSDRYAAASSDAERSALVAAAEALLARGVSHAPGTALAFLISSAGALAFSLVMLKGGVFSRTTAIVGIVGNSALMAFEIVSAFVPALYDPALAVAVIGGLGFIAWYGMVGVRLLALARE